MNQKKPEWHRIHSRLVFGRGWKKTKNEFGRLPAHAEQKLPEKMWKMGRNSTGMYVEFQTDASDLFLRWDLAEETLGEPNFNICAHSGADLYCFSKGKWRFAAIATAAGQKNETVLLPDLDPEERRFRLYFPLRNCVEKISLGVNAGAALRWIEPDGSPQVIYYGSSIIHGSSSSRSGNGVTGLLGRALNKPIVNLGFSGMAKLDEGTAELLTETTGEFYIIDPLPNCDAPLVKERLEKFLRILCSAKKTTPVFFLTDWDRRNEWLFPKSIAMHRKRRSTSREIVNRLRKEYPQLYLIDMARSMGNDAEGSVEGVHPDELGMFRFTEYLTRALRKHFREVR